MTGMGSGDNNRVGRIGAGSAIASLAALVVFFLFLRFDSAVIQGIRVASLLAGPILSLYSLGSWFYESRRRVSRTSSHFAVRLIAFFLWAYVVFAYIYRIFINRPLAP